MLIFLFVKFETEINSYCLLFKMVTSVLLQQTRIVEVHLLELVLCFLETKKLFFMLYSYETATVSGQSRKRRRFLRSTVATYTSYLVSMPSNSLRRIQCTSCVSRHRNQSCRSGWRSSVHQRQAKPRVSHRVCFVLTGLP